MLEAPGFHRGRNRLRRAVAGNVLVLLLAGAAGGSAASLELASRLDPSQVSGTGAHASGLFQGPDFFAPPPPSLSQDGRYAVFLSTESNLVPGQRNAMTGRNVFLQDLLTGTTTLVSHVPGSPTTAGNDDSPEAVLSGDGRYVAFTSRATDIAPDPSSPPGFSHSSTDLLLYDRVTDTTSVIFRAFVGLGVHSPTISQDGRYIAFASEAPGQPQTQVFLYDRTDASLRLVSHISTSPTTGGSGASLSPAISADGRFVAFRTFAKDLVPGQSSDTADFDALIFDRDSGTLVLAGQGRSFSLSADGRFLAAEGFAGFYLFDRVTGSRTVLASHDPDADSLGPARIALSADGRYAALVSSPSRLLPAQPGGSTVGLYLYDRISRTFTLASRKHGSATASATPVATPTLSADGRFTAFVSRDPDLVSGQTDANGTWDVFLFDRTSGEVRLVSHARTSPSTTASGFSYSPGVSADGARVVFLSLAGDLVAGLADLNGGEDVFVYETASATTTAVTRRAPDMASLAAGGALSSVISADGRWVAYTSYATSVTAGQVDTNRLADVFLYDRATQATVLVSHSAGSATRAAGGESFAPSLSADGRWLAFASNAPDLLAGAPQNEPNIDFYLFDRVTGTTVLVGKTQFSETNIGPYPLPRLSADGRWVAFASSLPGLVPGQQDSGQTMDVFLWDRITGTTTLVSHAASAPTRAAGADSFQPRLSADGRYVAFLSGATNLIPGQIDQNGETDLFVYDRTNGKTVLASHTRNSQLTAASADSRAFSEDAFSMSSDGRYLLFTISEGTDPGPGLYVYDRTSGAVQSVAPLSAGVISDDGRFVAFVTSAPVLPGVSPNGFSQLYLQDRTTGTTSLITRSITPGHTGADEDSGSLSISADGRYVAFASYASDLTTNQPPITPADPFSRANVFLYDRATASTMLLSPNRPGSVFDGFAASPSLSASGRQTAFLSTLDLVEGDYNLDSDIYVFSFDPPPSSTGPVSLPACTLLDTRQPAGRPALRSDARRTLKAAGVCGVPASAKQIAVKVTLLQGSGKGNVRFYPGNTPATAAPSGILRFAKGQTVTGTFTLPLSNNGTGTLALLPFVAGKGTVQAVVEVNGYVP